MLEVAGTGVDGRFDALADRALQGEAPTREEALGVLATPDDELLSLLAAAFRVRRRYFGRKVKLADGLRHRDELRIGSVEARFLIFNDQSALSSAVEPTNESSIEVVWDDATQPSG